MSPTTTYTQIKMLLAAAAPTAAVVAPARSCWAAASTTDRPRTRGRRCRCRPLLLLLTAKAKTTADAVAAPDNTQQQKGSGGGGGGSTVWGSALLVSGTTIGAGILALPAVTQQAGFVPSAAALTVAAGFSIATGLLLAEVALAVRRRSGAGRAGDDDIGDVSLLTMARVTLGDAGATAAGFAYVFLHAALLVAYTSKAGEIIGGAVGVPPAAAGAAFALSLAATCFFTSDAQLDASNGVLVAGVVGTFVALLAAAAPGVDAASIIGDGAAADWAAVPRTLPVVALSFVFHNLCSVVVERLNGDAGRVRAAIVSGIALPWLMFVSWDGVVLGSLGTLEQQQQQQQQQQQPVAVAATAPASISATREATQQPDAASLPAPPLSSADQQQPQPQPQQRPRVDDPLAALAASSSTVGPLVSGFSLLAIATSYVGFVLGLTQFLADALGPAGAPGGARSPLPYALTVLPPLLVAATYPDLFLAALNAAGTYGVLTLFGVLPAAMAWAVRGDGGDRGGGGGGSASSSGSSSGQEEGTAAVPALVPGGRAGLVLVGGAAAAVIANELAQLLLA